ncbi:MAG: hydrogenase maturation nickel metallochaperone HypA [Pirellulales bacterium]
MHEMSLVRSLLAQVREFATAHGGGTVRRVRVQVGPLSGVEPVQLASAWRQLCGPAALEEAQLEIEEVALEVRCQQCQGVFRPESFSFRCPACDSTQTEVVAGEGVILDNILLDELQQGVPQ